MEPLALLCNLYGEGPQTLRRLQRAGFEALASLLAVEADELAERTGWPLEEAARLLQEAVALAARSDAALLEPEPPSEALPSPAEPADDAGGSSPPAAEDSRARLLETGRELDVEAPPSSLEDVLVPAPPPHAGLDLGALEEGVLSEAVRTRLLALGIRGVADLAAAPTLELSRELGLGYTRLDRLQHLARRKLSAAPTPERSTPRLPRDPGVGGPFA